MTVISSFGSTEQPQYLREYLASAATASGIRRVRAAGLALWDITGQLLDAGCGNGEVARELAALLPDSEVTALDHSADAIAEATRGHDGSQVRYEVGDIYTVPYADGHFDGVRTERVLQHLAEPDRAVAELARVLRPGGRMLLIDTDWDSLLVDGSPAGFNDRLRELFAEARRQMNAAGDPSSGRTLRRRMIQAGLTDVRVEPVTVAFTDIAEASLVLPLRREMIGAVIEDTPVTQAWFTDLDAAVADGTFLATLTMWVAAGAKA